MQALRALGWLLGATAAVRVVPYATLTRAMTRIGPGGSGAVITPEACAAAIRRAARIWPAGCLPQAIAASCLLRRAGLTPRLTLGVSQTDARFDAHAWLECNGVVVTGAATDRHYTPLTAGGRQTR